MFGKTAEGDTVPLDVQTEYSGDGRYIIDRMVGDGHHVVVKVKPSYDRPAYPDHRIDCPDFNDGRT